MKIVKDTFKKRYNNWKQTPTLRPELETHVKCDASRWRLGAALKQMTQDGYFASRFEISDDKRYKFNEVEVLVEVWSIEHLN